ncbi:ABC transporter ATP-binding protein [Spirochaetia bacterium]|nr:ABC transporter ATP-binding protein [Spirochaetia bacterium]
MTYPTNHVLEVKNLRTSFHTSGGVVSAVRGVSLHAVQGEFVGIVGESGCGKSASMLSIMRLLPENAGVRADTLRFDGRDLLTQSAQAMRKIQGNEIGMIFQDPMTCLNPLYTIGNQITEPLRIHKKMSRKEAKHRAVEMLDLVGIPSPEQRLRQYPHEFSGGMRQRVMIAMAMCCNPKLLIADEPTTALDVTIQAQILDLMTALKEKFSTATILITHDLGVVASTCSRVLVMYGGLVMEEGSPDDIFYRPLHPYTRGLLRSVPNVGSNDKEKLIPIQGSPPDLIKPPAGCPFAARCDDAMRICAVAPPPRTSDRRSTDLRSSDRRSEDTHSAVCWLLAPAAIARRGKVVTDGPVRILEREAKAAGLGQVTGNGPGQTVMSGAGQGQATEASVISPLLDVQNMDISFTIRTGAFGKQGARQLRAVNGASFSIKKGETFGLVGESGCGKTTVGRAILKLYPISGGKVVYNGQDITGLQDKEFFPFRRKMQMIFQDPYTALDPRQPVSEIIGAPMTMHRLVSSDTERNERVKELLHMVGLKDDHINRYPHEFSGGQRQRIGIARALALMPEFIVCDEPISALDVSIQAQIINILEEFQQKFGFTYLFISHDLTMIRHLSHNVGVMYLGNLVEIADSDEIYTNMRHPYTQSLMSAAPVADPRLSKSLNRIILKGDVPSPLDPPSGCPFRTRCSRVLPYCAEETPALREVGPGHKVACHNML